MKTNRIPNSDVIHDIRSDCPVLYHNFSLTLRYDGNYIDNKDNQDSSTSILHILMS